MRIITTSSSVCAVTSARVHVYVLCARVPTNETNKFTLARMRTCWWKFPDSRESSRVRSHARENVGFFLHTSSSA